MSSPSYLLPAVSPCFPFLFPVFTSIPKRHSLGMIQDPDLSNFSCLGATLTGSSVSPTEVLNVKAADGKGRGLCYQQLARVRLGACC